jgi:hypothetical protein
MASADKSQQLFTKACWMFHEVWFLKRHVGVAAVKGLAKIFAGQPDGTSVFLGIQEVQDVVQGNVWESFEGIFASGQLDQ